MAAGLGRCHRYLISKQVLQQMRSEYKNIDIASSEGATSQPILSVQNWAGTNKQLATPSFQIEAGSTERLEENTSSSLLAIHKNYNQQFRLGQLLITISTWVPIPSMTMLLPLRNLQSHMGSQITSSTTVRMRSFIPLMLSVCLLEAHPV